MAIKPYNYTNPQKTTTTFSGGIKPFVYNQGNPMAEFTQPKKTGFIPDIIGGLKTIGSDIKDIWTQPSAVKGPISPEGYLNQVQGWGQDVINSWQNAGSEIVKGLSNVDAKGKQKSFIDQAVGLGNAGMSVLNAFFTPITSVFTRAESAPGVIGGTASFVNKLFGTVGVVGADTGESLVQATPFLSQDTKDKITPIVKEISALAGQIVAGKVGGDVYNKLASKSKIVIDKISEDTRIKHLNETLPKDAIPKVVQPNSEVLPPETPTTSGIKPFDYSKTLQEQIGNPPEAPTTPKTAPEPTIVPKVDKSLEPLALEAKKYKSAEEFVNSMIYHGTEKPFDTFDFSKVGTGGTGNAHGTGAYFTSSPEIAKDYASGYGNVNAILNKTEGKLNGKVLMSSKPSGELLDFRKFAEAPKTLDFYKQGLKKMEDAGFTGVTKDTNVLQQLKRADLGKESFEQVLSKLEMEISNNSQYASKLNDAFGINDYFLPKDKFAGLIDNSASYPRPKATNVDGAKDIVLFDKGQPIKTYPAMTKSQLTDIWNKAVEKPTAVAPKPIENTPSGVAQSIERKAIEDNLTKKFDKVAGYDASTIKEQARIFDETASKGVDTLRSVIRGETPLPDKAKGFPFIVAMEKFIKDHPELNKNGELSYELANSPHVTSASEAGSQLGLGQNRVQDAFTKKVEEIKKAKAIRAKSSPEKTAKIKTQAQESMKKVNLSKAELGKIEKFINENLC